MQSANQGLSRLRQPQVLAFSTVPDAIWAILVDCKMADRHRIRTLQAVYGPNMKRGRRERDDSQFKKVHTRDPDSSSKPSAGPKV